MAQLSSRRRFLAALGGGATALWFADHFTAAEEAAAHAEHLTQATQPRRLEFFTAAEARDAEAIAARIIPNDDGTPGAREAGVLFFLDHIAARHNPGDARQVLRDGLATLAKDVAARHPGSRFARLTSQQQDELLRERETTPFFDVMRTLTLGGFLSSRKYGGNRNLVGWKFVGHDPSPTYQPPFGYYDQPAVRRRSLSSTQGDA